jgi:hypothetical protein
MAEALKDYSRFVSNGEDVGVDETTPEPSTPQPPLATWAQRYGKK